jgi:tripartite-type tricarboxylate transporter receptor subunit TctC
MSNRVRGEGAGNATARFHQSDGRPDGNEPDSGAGTNLSLAANHDGGPVCRGRRIRCHGPDPCSAHERDSAYNQTIYKKPRYNAVADFTPLALFAEQPMVLDTRKDFPADNLAQFMDYVKANGASLQFGSAGAGTTTHLGCALLNAAIGVNVTHVPYRGGGPAANDLIGGQIDYMCSNIGGSLPLILGKKVKAIAMLSRDRSPLMPDLPTAHEQGLLAFDVVTWNAFFLPKGAPPEVVKKLNDATSQALDTPAIQTRLHELGVAAVAPERRSPEYLAKFVVDEIARWEGPIKANGLQVD